MTPPQDADKPTMTVPEFGAVVRMYNTGFGDCFLLAFRATDGRPRYLLIDCGAHQDYQGGAARLREIAADISAVAKDGIDVVAVTHEHWDHLAGFCRARNIFEGMPIGQLWLAWPENGEDPDARRLKKLYGVREEQLCAAIESLRQTKDPLLGVIESILGSETRALSFDGEGFDCGLSAGEVPAADETSKAAQYRFLRRHSGSPPPPYLEPKSQPLSLPGVAGVRVYVLGPPREKEHITETDLGIEPLTGLPVPDQWAAFYLALRAYEKKGAANLEAAEKAAYDRSLPFDPISPCCIALDDLRQEPVASGLAEQRAFFMEHYDLSGEDPEQAWRRIETDWLRGALAIVLRDNAYVNNSSLVLAIELTGHGLQQVLLFCGDAQIGSWRSWEDLSWESGAGGPAVTGKELIARTVFYKVGHHGSHNATLNEVVERMSSQLVAMIPVDKEWANGVKHWPHPADSVMTMLKDKTRGRIIRMDEISAGDAPPAQPPEATAAEWQEFLSRLEWDRQGGLWIQYTVGGSVAE